MPMATIIVILVGSCSVAVVRDHRASYNNMVEGRYLKAGVAWTRSGHTRSTEHQSMPLASYYPGAPDSPMYSPIYIL